MLILPFWADSDDLWTTAVAKLRDEDRCNIDFDRPEKLGILSELLKVTQKEGQRCVGKAWRFKRQSGETVIVRDLFAKIAQWIDHFKAVGDVVAQYDPVHTALPWAGVRFLLQVSLLKIEREIVLR